MNLRFKHILTPLLVGAVAFSCEQKDQDQVNPSSSLSASATSSATSANIMYNETFEGSSVFSGLHDQFGTSHAFKVVSSPVFEGAKSGRFELRDSDPLTSSGTRSEVLFPENSVGKERWYSFKAYYPSSGYKTDSNNDILNQWHQGGGTGSPSTTLRVKNDRFFMKIGNVKEERKDFDLGAQTKDMWHEFVIHIVHSNGSDGLVEVWRNGTKVLTHKGGNMYNADLPRWKVGIYKDDWNGSETTDTNVRIFYLDNIRMGNENASYTEMASGQGATTTAPAPTTTTEPTAPETTEPVSGDQPIASFSLIDAATEKGVLTITNNSKISLSSLENTKLNIRANTASTVSKVKFELSGAQSKSYTDSSAPFALHGDNGSGNFYYGNWNPPAAGTYTLKATPYDASGNAGAATTITFTITNSGETVLGTTTSTTSTTTTTTTAPAPSTTTTVSGQLVTGFTLIDSHTESGVMTIADGAVIKLSSLKNTKLNIRANTASSVGSVKLELSGAQSKTYVDDAAPYALHGDNGDGNYYYGNWNPPATGTYTLKATPYSGADATGTAGAPTTITFTIVK